MLNLKTFGENGIGEPEQDANSSLTELDKGLRSNNFGEQCEAIVRFPRLFERYPFPILINSSFLKLSDLFRIGNNNFLRLWILRVCQQSEKHLDKISNVDEFVRRVYSVIHSNDPIARALTLRTLGAVAGIIPERQQVHHSIRRSLDSHDNVEVEAAIYAARRFAAQSKTFAVSMCKKISDMIEGQGTPANMKLQLIPILQYMHHDTSTSGMVRNLCKNLLTMYPAQDFVLVTLNTLTKLAVATIVDIPNQVTLLLQYLRTDPRWEVKLKSLHFLYQLAKPGSHLWPSGAIESIVDVALETEATQVLSLTLDVIRLLTESPKVCKEHKSLNSKLLQFCFKNCYSPEPQIAVKAIEILISYHENLDSNGNEEVISALDVLILQLTLADKEHPKQLKLALKCAVQLCKVKREYCASFVDLLGSNLKTIDGDCAITICEALGAIGELQVDALLPLLKDILELFNQLSNKNEFTSQEIEMQVMLCTLVFQTMTGYQWNTETVEAIRKVTTKINLWANYKIARAAIRYGHHKIAYDIFSGLTEQVSSENLHFWLVSLKEMCLAESCLIEDTGISSLVKRLNLAIVHYNKAIAALKAASTPSHNLQFQAEYMRLRTEFFQSLVDLIYTCNTLCIVPPPAIASTIVQTTKDEYQRHGYITNRMRKCIKDFENCGEMYWKLYKTAFDADPSTLENIKALQQICDLVEKCIESVCVDGEKVFELDKFESENTRLELQQLIKCCQESVKIAQVIKEDVAQQTITHKHVDVLKRIIQVLISVSLPIPRYFFQALQSTVLTLAISPQPRVMGEFISVQFGSQLAIKIEGIVQHGEKPGRFRHAEGIMISITSQLQANLKNKEVVDIKMPDANSLLTQTVTPHKDFFSAQFLLSFPRGGQYLITIDSSVIDENGNVWKTGPKSTLTVKVPEETKHVAIAMPGVKTTTNNVILMSEDHVSIRPTQKKITIIQQ